MAMTNIQLELDAALVERAQQAGTLNRVVNDALRRRLDFAAEDAAREQRWAEENALLIEALAGGACEAVPAPR
jgi:hypothetical protein